MKTPRPQVPAALLALVLAVALLAPGLRQWGHAFLATRHVDAWGTLWFYWYLGEVVAGRASLEHTDLLFHPWGKDLYLHTGGNLLDAALALPFRAAFGDLLGYDLFVVLLLLANGAAAAWCARRAGAAALGAAVAGTLFAANPFALSELSQGRATQALLVFPCLFVGELMGAGAWKGPWPAVRAGLWLALTGLAYWFYALFAGAAALALAAGAWWQAAGRRGALLGQLSLAALVALGLVVPFAWPMLRAQSAGQVPGLLDPAAWSLWTWAPRTTEGFAIALRTLDPVLGAAGFYLEAEEGLRWYPESTVLFAAQALLVTGGLAWAGRRRGALLAALLLALALACGPVLEPRLGLVDPLYLGLVQVVPPLQRLWWPVRAVALVQVLAVVPTAVAIDRLAGGGRWRAWLVVVVLGAAWLAELHRAALLPLPLTTVAVPRAYRCLAVNAAGPGNRGGLLELPEGKHPERLFYQTVHGHPINSGMLDDNEVLASPKAAALARDNALLVWLDAATSPAGAAPGDPSALAPARQDLLDLGFRYVVVDRSLLRGEGAAGERARRLDRSARVRLLEVLGKPVYDGDDALVYQLAGQPWSCDPAL